MTDCTNCSRGWNLFLRNASAIFLAVALLLHSYVAAAQTTSQQNVEDIRTADKTLQRSELPEEFASCFQNVDSSVRFLLPHVRGSLWSETWQESDTFLPILMLDNTVTLYFLEKDKNDVWHARQMKELFSFTDFSQDNDIKLIAIDTFGYWPETIVPYDGSTLEGTFYYNYTVTTGETAYVIGSNYEKNKQANSGWTWEALQVLPISQAEGVSTTVESDCFSGIRFDSWKVCRVGNNLQYQYDLHDQCNLMFDVETPYAEDDYDMLVMDERILLGEPQLFFSVKIDTDKHGKGKTVNLRERPEGKIIKKLPNNALVQISSRSNDWCLVKYGDLWGFVDARFLVGTDAYE